MALTSVRFGAVLVPQQSKILKIQRPLSDLTIKLKKTSALVSNAALADMTLGSVRCNCWQPLVAGYL
jgi:hypothetical protein